MVKKPLIRIAPVLRPVRSDKAENAGVSPSDIQKAGADYPCVLVNVRDVWLEKVIEWNETKWIAALRLVPQDGRPVIGEVRIFPAEAESKRPYIGQWSGEYLGMEGKVPAGGIPARLLREVPVNEVLRQGEEALANFHRLWEKKAGKERADEGFERRGLTAMMTERKKDPRGRKPHSDEYLAKLAREYVNAIHAGSERPVAQLAEKKGKSVSKIRSDLYTARRRELLTPARRGYRGGELTPRAREVLGLGMPTKGKTQERKGGRRASKK